MAKLTACPICESTQIAPAFQMYYWRENLLDFSDCTDCRATFANPMPSDLLISRGNSALVRMNQQNRSDEQEYREARQAYLRGKMMAGRLRRWKKSGRLLELGCHHGFYLMGIRENSDWQVEGLEISEELSQFVQQKLGVPCHLGTLENTTLPDHHYDLIVCHDLIEHINRPRIFLDRIAAILAPGGRIEIITPNSIQDLGFARRAFAAGMPVTMLLNHIMYFAPGTLRLALERLGLRIRRLYGYDIRYALKDFGLLGLGKIETVAAGPSLEKALLLKERQPLNIWTSEALARIRVDPKVSRTYGFFRETLPKAMTLHIPERFGVGHEIYCLAEK